jgi:hypothetical protein
MVRSLPCRVCFLALSFLCCSVFFFIDVLLILYYLSLWEVSLTKVSISLVGMVLKLNGMFLVLVAFFGGVGGHYITTSLYFAHNYHDYYYYPFYVGRFYCNFP